MNELSTALRVSLSGVWSIPPSSVEGQLLLFLLLNYAFLIFEILFGSVVQSLGLVCDGVHMLINCFGITISWLAFRVAKSHKSLGKPAHKSTYTYGFRRLHTLAAFTNAVFLVFVAVFLVVQALQRLFHPVDIHSSHAVTVALASLGLNLFGYCFLGAVATPQGSVERAGADFDVEGGRRSRAASNSGSNSLSNSGSNSGLNVNLNLNVNLKSKLKSGSDFSGFGKGGSGLEMKWEGRGESAAAWMNLQSVSAHLKADIYSSCGVIVSTLSSRWRGWTIMDPLVSIVILALIMHSALPLLVRTGFVLLQTTPKEHRMQLEQAVRELNTLKGVIECHEHHFWTLNQGDVVATIKLRVRDDASRDQVLLQAFRCLPPW